MRNLLFIDDNVLLVKALSMVFTQQYNVTSFSKSDEAMEYVETHKEQLDIVLTDFKMPIFNGIDVLKKCKELKPDTIRILLTGYAEYAVISENKDVFDLLLDKNVYMDQKEIARIIDSISQRRSRSKT